MSAAAAKTARSGTVDAGAAAVVTAAVGVIRADCDAHNHVAGGTPASSADATTAVRLFRNHGRGAAISSWRAACRTIDALIGDTPRRRARSSARSHRRMTGGGMPAEIVAIAFTAGLENSSAGNDATPSLLSMYSTTSSRFNGLKRHRRAIR